jgi:hypothetical protein
MVSHKDKHFIADLASQCFSQLLESLPVSTAMDILISEHRRKHDDARVQIAAAMVKLVGRMADFSRLLKPLAVLMKDRNPNVRKSARLAVSAVRAKARNFDQMVDLLESEEERITLQEAF